MLFEGKLCGILMDFRVHVGVTCFDVRQIQTSSTPEGSNPWGLRWMASAVFRDTPVVGLLHPEHSSSTERPLVVSKEKPLYCI